MCQLCLFVTGGQHARSRFVLPTVELCPLYIASTTCFIELLPSPVCLVRVRGGNNLVGDYSIYIHKASIIHLVTSNDCDSTGFKTTVQFNHLAWRMSKVSLLNGIHIRPQRIYSKNKPTISGKKITEGTATVCECLAYSI